MARRLLSEVRLNFFELRPLELGVVQEHVRNFGSDLGLIWHVSYANLLIEPEAFKCLDGGCAKACQEEMACGHLCSLMCHPFSHESVSCKKSCNRRLKCGHTCIELCYLPCKSSCACNNDFEAVDPETHTQPHSDIPQSIQPFRDYAAGGHVEADRRLHALADRDAAKARGQQLDKENYAALFSDPSVLVDKTEKMTLARTRSNGEGGSRGVWKGTYEPQSTNASPTKEKEISLLDL